MGKAASINCHFIIANNHPKLLSSDIYAEANLQIYEYKHAHRTCRRRGTRAFRDRIFTIIYASRAYGFRFYAGGLRMFIGKN